MPSLALVRALRAERRLLPRLRRFLPLLVRRRRAPLTAISVATEPRLSRRAARARPERQARPGAALTVVSVIRNGVENGYPFVEAYASWERFAERIVVVDGESRDGTDRVLAELSSLVPQVEVVSRPWPERSVAGSAIADLTQDAFDVARDGEARLVYVQADEIYTDEQRELVHGWTEGALEFAGCVNFWNSLDRVLADDFPMRYVRVLPPDAEAVPLGDGYSFRVAGAVTTTQERFLHYGWCFAVNILRKHVSHARLYPESAAYRLRGFLARRMLETGSTDPRLLDALAPYYRSVPFEGEHPECMRHLVGRTVYDPYVGLELLAGGARW